jgi:hypothetical protein
MLDANTISRTTHAVLTIFTQRHKESVMRFALMAACLSILLLGAVLAAIALEKPIRTTVVVH